MIICVVVIICQCLAKLSTWKLHGFSCQWVFCGGGHCTGDTCGPLSAATSDTWDQTAALQHCRHCLQVKLWVTTQRQTNNDLSLSAFKSVLIPIDIFISVWEFKSFLLLSLDMMSGWFQSIFQRDTIIKAGQNIILHWMLDARQIASPGLAKTKRWMDGSCEFGC